MIVDILAILALCASLALVLLLILVPKGQRAFASLIFSLSIGAHLGATYTLARMILFSFLVLFSLSFLTFPSHGEAPAENRLERMARED